MGVNIKSVINQAYQMAGIVQNGKAANGTQTGIGEVALNQILAQLNEDQLFPYSRELIKYQIAASKEFYTIGDDVSADIVSPRPAFVNRIVYLYTNDSRPRDVQQQAFPDLIARRRSSSSTGTPYFYSVNPEYPLAKLYFDTKPSAGGHILIVYNKEIPEVSANTELQAPATYAQVMVTHLAVWVAKNDQMPQDTIANC